MRPPLFSSVFVLVALVACTSDDTSSSASPASDPLEHAQPVVENYAANVYQNYVDTLDGAKKLKVAIEAFTAAPGEATHQAAKDAWVASRKPYCLTEAYRFYNGPIDNDDPASPGPEGDLNSWPLDENFIDYTKDEPSAGLINDPTFEITKESLAKKNTEGGEANISDGYHAIEFLLWGQDTDEPSRKTQGHRSFTDYTTAKNADRRKAYLLAVTDLLLDDLQTVTDAWTPNAENYRKAFVADPKGAVTKILTGIGSLSNAELSGERMTVAYKDKSQEDEHSCFSDTTDADLEGNFLGIQNVYLGTYGSNTTGAGISTLVAAIDPTLDAKVKDDLRTTAAAFEAMQAQPFDHAIQLDDASPERRNILQAIQGVKTLADDITQVGAKLGVSFQVEASEARL
jgi:putative iron-regulated protein